MLILDSVLINNIASPTFFTYFFWKNPLSAVKTDGGFLLSARQEGVRAGEEDLRKQAFLVLLLPDFPVKNADFLVKIAD